MDSGVEFVAVDNPTAASFKLHILAAVTEHAAAINNDQGFSGDLELGFSDPDGGMSALGRSPAANLSRSPSRSCRTQSGRRLFDAGPVPGTGTAEAERATWPL